MQDVDATTADVAFSYEIETTGTYDTKMTLEDCKDASFGTFYTNIKQ